MFEPVFTEIDRVWGKYESVVLLSNTNPRMYQKKKKVVGNTKKYQEYIFFPLYCHFPPDPKISSFLRNLIKLKF